jgi:hypothetical protein
MFADTCRPSAPTQSRVGGDSTPEEGQAGSAEGSSQAVILHSVARPDIVPTQVPGEVLAVCIFKRRDCV